MIRLDELPAGKLRDRVLAQLAADEANRIESNRKIVGDRPPAPTKAARAGNSEARTRSRARPRLGYRCGRCGTPSSSYKAAEAHADEQRHPRIEAVI